MNLSFKYWRKHKNRACLILISISLCTAALTCIAFLFRSVSAMEYEEYRDICGDYDALIPHIDEESLNDVYECKDVNAVSFLYNGGYCESNNGTENLYGAFEDDEAVEMFHYTPEHDGRYPQMSGEITGYKTTFEEMGVAPRVGNSIEIEINDEDGNIAYKKDFVIVGVLNDQRNQYNNLYREFHEGDYEFPKLFIYKNDLPDSVSMTAMIMCKPDVSVDQLINQLREKHIFAYEGMRIASISAKINVMADTEEELYSRISLASKDFYASNIMPFFMVLSLFLAGISLYAIISNAMTARIKQVDLCRNIGLSYKDAMIILVKEAIIFSIIGVACGFAVGVALYATVLSLTHGMLFLKIPYSFSVDKIVRSMTVDPYLISLAFGFIVCVTVFVIALVKTTHKIQTKSLYDSTLFYRRHNLCVKNKRLLMKKCITGNGFGKVAYLLLVFSVVSSSIFGCLFFMSKADFDNSLLEQRLQEMGMSSYDYAAVKDMNESMMGNVQFNRHNEGMTQKSFNLIERDGQVKDVTGLIRLPGIKALYNKRSISDRLREVLDEVNIKNNIEPYIMDLDEKTLLYQGYEKDDLLYNMPFTALTDSFLGELCVFAIDGRFDVDSLSRGEEIIVAVYDDIANNLPYEVGDIITFTDAVIDDEYIEKYDFSSMVMPEGYEPNCYYKYDKDSMEEIPGYAFGKKITFESRIGAIIMISDEKTKTLVHTKSFVLNKEKNGFADVGYDFLCSTSAIRRWGLPDENYTNVFVTLKSKADIEAFEDVWYGAMGDSKGMMSISRENAEKRLCTERTKNMLIYYTMLVIIMFQGVLCMINLIKLIVRQSTKNISIMRALGGKKCEISWFYISLSAIVTVISVVLSLIPIWIFDVIRKYAYEYGFSNGHNFAKVSENGKLVYCWQVMFPWYIELWEQPVLAVILTVGVFAVVINVASSIIALYWSRRRSIVELVKDEKF